MTEKVKVPVTVSQEDHETALAAARNVTEAPPSILETALAAARNVTEAPPSVFETALAAARQVGTSKKD